MEHPNKLKPDYVFEVSWEVCNKVGGIHTVISTKAPFMCKEYGEHYIVLGPDVWKETLANPEFTEDIQLFRAWKEKAQSDGLNIRIGHWNIPCRPIAILVDFTTFFSRKDQILAEFWETYQLDSISGGWDYIEPVMFGYGAAKVIENFYEFHFTSRERIIAHFHEWMTGAGVLYLEKYVPQAGTVFTTHATMLGRAIAGNGKLLYENMEKLDAGALAHSYQVTSKYSLERCASNVADCFTTVSEITSRECKLLLGKETDFVTPNGFDPGIIPGPGQMAEKRAAARETLLEVTRKLTCTDIPDDSVMLLISGRYEFRNKGIDLFIESLGELNQLEGAPILACIMVPANVAGPNRALLEDCHETPSQKYLTHFIHHEEYDPVLHKIRESGLSNNPDDRVKIIFIPAYMNGNDGIFNLHYYDLLAGFDLTVFPSYYEPWGYTPLESAAFGIPTVTTTLAGFGLWIKSVYRKKNEAVKVLTRTDTNTAELLTELIRHIQAFTLKNPEEKESLKSLAAGLSKTSLWDEFFGYYREAYSFALSKSDERFELFRDKRQPEAYFLKDIPVEQKPIWNRIVVEPSIPKGLEKLSRMFYNLWWTWNHEAEELFEQIDPELWKQSGRNPRILAELLNINRLKSLEKDSAFIQKVDAVYAKFQDYMALAEKKPKEKIAYFSMEFGLDSNIKTYSGGLGILAGDYLKEASDSNKNMVGVGLLYRYGYFQQSISFFGDQIAEYHRQKFSHLPLSRVFNGNGELMKIRIALPGRTLFAQVWKVKVGRIMLYLLDTDISDNSLADRNVTHQLYGGDWENRFKQELLLGVGGIRALNELGIEADVYHINEGHAAFLNLERLRILVQEKGLTFHQALEVVRASSLFTTHTPVPAGHDFFDENLLRTYISHYPERLNISWQDFMNLGKFRENDPGEKFSMSVLAVKMSQEVNGVSKIHGRVSREMFHGLYEGYYADELHIGYVTNGVHHPTWTGSHWIDLYRKHFGEEYLLHQSDASFWEKIREVPDAEIWKLRNHYRKDLIQYLKDRLTDELTRRQENPKLKLRMVDALDENALTICFSRRFATYKRAHLLFSNPERLSALLNNKQFPIQIIYAGKAHPADGAGQDLIKRIVEMSRKPDFAGKIFFIENYDMELAKKLVRGVDIWLNTPTRPLEASGTSGEKAVMNGVLNLSVLDGWWAEGYRPHAGWALREARTYVNQQFQDELDSETIYDLLEDEILPVFYQRDNGIPKKWVSYIKNCISQIAPHYTMKRMLDDYQHKYYDRLIRRSKDIRSDDYQLARDIEAWKSKMRAGWNHIEVRRIAVPDPARKSLDLGDNFIAEIELKLNGIKGEDLGLDILFGQKEMDTVNKIMHKEEMKMVDSAPGVAKFTCKIPMEKIGVYHFAFRLYPKKEWLAHKQDFNLVKWL
ncbi:MAG: alpha-glucan family phosphorylase [Bacteroidales bacterium]|nr:alpha-glucan family phosphorylase [Bacteroidales bacterium]